jgi:hypothetical protein
MRQSTRGTTEEVIIEMFLNNLRIVQANAISLGQRLVVRDHAHSHFHVGDSICQRPSLREIISSQFASVSVLTVRHPLDSYLSLEENGWVTFRPGTFDEYCRRYAEFIYTYDGVPLFKYEDFIEAPHQVMSNICLALQLPYSDQFVELFSLFKLTGESGRSSAFIEHMPRRRITETLRDELAQSNQYKELVAKLNYGE